MFLKNAATWVAATVFCAPILAETVRAGDLDDPVHDWSGFYVGAAINGASSSLDLKGVGGKNDLEAGSVSLNGLAGYNFTSGPFVWGVEVDIGSLGTDKSVAIAGLGTVRAQSDWNAAMALRAGWAFDDVLLFAKVGVAFTDLDLTSTAGGRKNETLTGGVVGIGAEYAVNSMWSLRAEADVYGFSDDAVLAGTARDLDLGQGVVRVGVTAKF